MTVRRVLCEEQVVYDDGRWHLCGLSRGHDGDYHECRYCGDAFDLSEGRVGDMR